MDLSYYRSYGIYKSLTRDKDSLYGRNYLFELLAYLPCQLTPVSCLWMSEHLLIVRLNHFPSPVRSMLSAPRVL